MMLPEAMQGLSRDHTIKSLKALQSLREKRSLPLFFNNVIEAFQCSALTYTMK